jgi:acetyltransferase EpsM
MQNNLVIWGALGHALVVADIILLRAEYKIVGVLDDKNPEIHYTEFCGALVFGGQEQLDVLPQMGVKYLIFGFGDCKARLRLAELMHSKGYHLATAIHPQTVIAVDVPIGKGTVIAVGAIINPGSMIGENAIVNTCARVDHECVIEDGVHICPGVHVGGRVRIGLGIWVGIVATIRDRIHIDVNTLWVVMTIYLSRLLRLLIWKSKIK